MIASVLEVKGEIPFNGLLVCFDSLPARDRRICMVMQSPSIYLEQSWVKIALFR
jgi:ABC-type sugar transport system ATPase subunit